MFVYKNGVLNRKTNTCIHTCIFLFNNWLINTTLLLSSVQLLTLWFEYQQTSGGRSGVHMLDSDSVYHNEPLVPYWPLFNQFFFLIYYHFRSSFRILANYFCEEIHVANLRQSLFEIHSNYIKSTVNFRKGNDPHFIRYQCIN